MACSRTLPSLTHLLTQVPTLDNLLICPVSEYPQEMLVGGNDGDGGGSDGGSDGNCGSDDGGDDDAVL